MREVVHSLPEREREVIQMRFGLDGERDPVSVREAARRLEIRPADVQSSSAARSRSWRCGARWSALRDAA